MQAMDVKYALVLPAAGAIFVLASEALDLVKTKEETPAEEGTDTDAELAVAGIAGGITGIGLLLASTQYLRGDTSVRSEGTMSYSIQWGALTLLPLATKYAMLSLKRSDKKESKVTKKKAADDEPVSDLEGHTLLAFSSQLVLASYLHPEQLQVVPMMASIFVTGTCIGDSNVKRKSAANSFRRNLVLASSLGALGFSAVRLFMNL